MHDQNLQTFIISWAVYSVTLYMWDMVAQLLMFILYREESFPRLGQMIVDYDPPIKKLADEFIPHSKVRSV